MIHVGSLIIDDFQDESKLRRGGPTVHIEYGDAIAINAGCAAYFNIHNLTRRLKVPSFLVDRDCCVGVCVCLPAYIPPLPMSSIAAHPWLMCLLCCAITADVAPQLTDEARIRLFDEYFMCMKVGHLGQCLDLAGLEDVMDDAIARRDNSIAMARLLACHRLKTAVPAACMARIGAIIGGGSLRQVEVLGLYFEGIGLAFQVIDDVINLRGIVSKVCASLLVCSLSTVHAVALLAIGCLSELKFV